MYFTLPSESSSTLLTKGFTFALTLTAKLESTAERCLIVAALLSCYFLADFNEELSFTLLTVLETTSCC